MGERHGRRRFLTAGLLLALALFLPAAAISQQRVVAVGDIHGAYGEFVTLLERLGLIDASRAWTGGAAILVQVGDVLDRGAEARACLDLLMALERQAERKRGRVIAMLGNHEVMNLMGDLRYVPPEMYRDFATANSETVRERAWRDYLAFLRNHREHGHASLAAGEPDRQKWLEAHPPGFFEFRDAFGPGGKYGRWLRKRPAAVQIGDGVFVHGGLNPALPIRSVAELNRNVLQELDLFDSIRQSLCDRGLLWKYMKMDGMISHLAEEIAWLQARAGPEDAGVLRQMQALAGVRTWLSASPEGPLWYRGLANEPEEKLAGGLETMLAGLKATYVVSGHTVQASSVITQRFDHRVFLIDTGMNEAVYHGTPCALEIRDSVFRSYCGDRPPVILPAPPGGAARR
jgi:hypothetical protein